VQQATTCTLRRHCAESQHDACGYQLFVQNVAARWWQPSCGHAPALLCVSLGIRWVPYMRYMGLISCRFTSEAGFMEGARQELHVLLATQLRPEEIAQYDDQVLDILIQHRFTTPELLRSATFDVLVGLHVPAALALALVQPGRFGRAGEWYKGQARCSQGLRRVCQSTSWLVWQVKLHLNRATGQLLPAAYCGCGEGPACVV
jgi:hypothetical protein